MLKNIAVIIMLLWANLAFSQHVVFPESFKAGEKMFPGLSVPKITPKLTAETGLLSASCVSDDSKFIQLVAKPNFPVSMIANIYYEVYQSRKDKSDDAGIIVIVFNKKADLDKILDQLHEQSNCVYLRKDNYLIKVWSDESGKSEATLLRLSKYYQDKIGATLLTTRSSEKRTTNEDVIEVEAAVPQDAPYEMITATAAVPKDVNSDKLSEQELEVLAYEAMQNNDYEVAISLYEQVLLKNPKNDRAHYNIVWMYATTNQNAEAIAKSQRALEVVSSNKQYEYLRFIGICYTDMGQYYDGMQYLQKANKLLPNQSLTIYNLGYNRFMAKDFQRAIDLLKLILKQYNEEIDKEADILFYIGTAYSELNNSDSALFYLEEAIQRVQYETYYANKAHIYSKLGNYEQAIVVCTEGISFTPESAVLYHKRFQAKKDLQQFASANDDLRQAFVLDENNPDILLDMAVLYDSDNKANAALALYHKALLSPNADKQKIYSNMANVLSKNALTLDSALMYYKMAIQENPKSFEPYYNYANTLRALEQFTEAEKFYKVANERQPNNKSVLTNLGLTLNIMGKNEEALQVLHQAYERYPNEYELNLSLAKIYLLDVKNYPLAEEHATKALQNSIPGKSNIAAYSIRGNARLHNESYQNAIADYLEIINRTAKKDLKERYELFSNIGYCYFYQKQYNNAAIYFKKCLNYQREVDALIGLALVAQASNKQKELAYYKRKTIAAFPKLKQGEEGLQALEAEGYHYSPDTRAQIISIFGK